LVFSPRIRIFFRFILFHWFIFGLFRLAFFFKFSGQEEGISFENIAQAFYLGSKFDLRAAIFLSMPLVFASWLPFIDIKKNKKFWLYLAGLAAVLWMGVFFTDFGYYDYLKTRVNSSLVTFLYNPQISFSFVWEHYPVFKGAIVFAALIYIYMNFLNRYILRQDFFRVKKSSMANVLGVAAFTAFFIGGLYGKLSYYPLRWSEAFFSPNSFTSYLALNPHLYLSRTIRHRSNTYDKEKLKENYDLLADYYEVDKPDKENLNFLRYSPAKEKDFGFKPNVVLIVMESYASFKTALWNNPLDAGPYLSKIAREGVYFSEYYVPVEGTARSMFALMSGVADLSKYKTASRNPMIVSQNVLMNAFKDHKKLYFLGGSANWGNIRGVFSNNIEDIEIMEEGKFSEERVDVWGLSDYHLFKEVERKLESLDKDESFFAVVQASSYHRPYTVPDNVPGFQWIEHSEEELKNAGFISNEEYNSFRFSDFSLGKFFEKVQNEEWFENTLFVITGDHGVPDYGAGFHLRSRVETETAPFHVPLVFYNKKIFPEPIEYKKTATEMDVFPSIAGVLGVEYYNQAMGRDLFDPKYDDKRYALTYTYHRTGEYGLIGDGYYLKVKPNSRALYKLDDSKEVLDQKEAQPEKFEYMSKLVDALMEFGKYMLHHNKPIKPSVEAGMN
jgi:phosphoglycerol transferase MdoB-like AlkP superfamily enzyme